MIAAAVGVLALCCCGAPAPTNRRKPPTLAEINARPVGTKKWAKEAQAKFKEEVGKAREFEAAALQEESERDELIRSGFRAEGDVIMLGSSIAPTVDFPMTAPAFLCQELPAPSLTQREIPNIGLHDISNT